MKRVTIWMDGGIIQDMKVPPGVRVTVFDYDVEGTSLPILKDRNGEEYTEVEWKPGDCK